MKSTIGTLVGTCQETSRNQTKNSSWMPRIPVLISPQTFLQILCHFETTSLLSRKFRIGKNNIKWFHYRYPDVSWPMLQKKPYYIIVLLAEPDSLGSHHVHPVSQEWNGNNFWDWFIREEACDRRFCCYCCCQDAPAAGCRQMECLLS